MSDRFCLSYRTKYQNGEIYPTIGRCGICFLLVRRFSGAAFFRRGVFSHARVRACGHMRARTHLCNACAFIIGARRTEFQLSAFYDSFAKLFYPASSQKAKLRNFRRKTVPKLAKSGKKREIRLETAKKRLFAAMKGRYSSERTVNRRKPAKEREKRKNEKKSKKFVLSSKFCERMKKT